MSNSAFSQNAPASSFADLTGVPDDNAALAAALAGKADAVPTYVAFIEQSGTDAPVATVLKNTLGGEVVWTYDGVGFYTGTLAGAFPPVRTAISFNPGFNTSLLGWDCSASTNDTVQILQYDNGSPADGIGSTSILKIEVYPAP
jgi:hypothetical protein